MTEIERLKADLATIQKAAEIAKEAGFHRRTGTYDMVEEDLKQKIADLEAQQELIDPWQTAKKALSEWESFSLLNSKEKRAIFAYVRSLEAKVDELNDELRCERIDGGKLRDDRKAVAAEKSREKLAELTTILNAIPPVCATARELVEKRIEGVKREMQGNG